VITLRKAATLALSLPEATERDHHGRTAFWVTGKIFATVWDKQHLNVMLATDSIERAVLAHPAMCEEFRWGKRLRAVHVDLTRVTKKVLEELLTEAWIRKAPRRLLSGPTRGDSRPLGRCGVEAGTGVIEVARVGASNQSGAERPNGDLGVFRSSRR
jgi:hypothetical protein